MGRMNVKNESLAVADDYTFLSQLMDLNICCKNDFLENKCQSETYRAK